MSDPDEGFMATLAEMGATKTVRWTGMGSPASRDANLPMDVEFRDRDTAGMVNIDREEALWGLVVRDFAPREPYREPVLRRLVSRNVNGEIQFVSRWTVWGDETWTFVHGYVSAESLRWTSASDFAECFPALGVHVAFAWLRGDRVVTACEERMAVRMALSLTGPGHGRGGA